MARDKNGKGYSKPKPTHQVIKVKTVRETEKGK